MHTPRRRPTRRSTPPTRPVARWRARTAVREGVPRAAIALWLTAGAATASDPDSAIGVDELRAHVTYLASDELLGRGTGQIGCQLAEAYIAGHFRGCGLEPLPGHDDLFLDYPLFRTGFDPARSMLAIVTDDTTVTAEAGRGFRPFDFSDEATVEAEVIFAGYGISAPELGWDDYADLVVDGKIVLVLRHEPGENDPDSPFDGTGGTSYATFVNKRRTAARAGAIGMLLVTDPLHHDPEPALPLTGGLSRTPPSTGRDTTGDERTGEGTPGDRGPRDRAGDDDRPFVALQITEAVASALLDRSGDELDELQRQLDDGHLHARDVRLDGARARASVTRREEAEPVPARNVAAYLRGSDPALRDELVVVGAHHDHLGFEPGVGDTVYNGADDNASGTAAVLALARAFASGPPPRRSMAFATWSGEERGLLGSRSMVDERQLLLDDVVFLLNLDMIGRNPDEPLDVMGDGFSPGLEDVMETANDGVGVSYALGGTSYSGNSDHAPFFEGGVPFLHFFSGFHDQYHQRDDHVELVAFEHMTDVVRLSRNVLSAVADLDVIPAFVAPIHWLGAHVELRDPRGESRAVIRSVDPDSKAEALGLAAGDVVIGLDDRRLTRARDLTTWLDEVEPGAGVDIELRRGDATWRVTVERAEPGFIGVRPQPLDDTRRAELGLRDDQGLVLSRIVPDGPADEAGLASGDVLVGLAGRPVSDGTLRAVLAQIGAGETVVAEIIRGTERIEVTVTLGRR